MMKRPQDQGLLLLLILYFRRSERAGTPLSFAPASHQHRGSGIMSPGITPDPFGERFQKLRTRLQDLKYHQPIDVASAPLVEALVSDL